MSGTLVETGLTTGHAPFVEEARSRGELYITQAYELYSEENHEAWRQLFARIQPKWERYANPHFLRRCRGPATSRTTASRASAKSIDACSR